MRDSYPKSLATLVGVGHLTDDSIILRYIQKRTKFLLKLNTVVLSLLPKEFKNWCRVANYRQHILILEVTNANRKARLNYEIPRLFTALRNTIAPSIDSINIMINPSFLIQQSQQTDLKSSSTSKCAHIIRDLALALAPKFHKT